MPNRDRPLLGKIRRATANDFQQQQFFFSDDRYNQLLFLITVRDTFPKPLSDSEQKSWLESCRWRLTSEESGYLTLEKNNLELEQLLGR